MIRENKARFFVKFNLFVLAVVYIVGCNTITPPPPPSIGTDDKGRTTEILQEIKQNKTLRSDVVYILEGPVYVESGVTLTIEAGTIIKGSENKTYQTKGALIVKKGGKIIAEGTIDKPIVFTSSKPKGSRKAGDWGGIIICGQAPVNSLNSPKLYTDLSTEYGGSNPTDNSGILKYVRIEFAGAKGIVPSMPNTVFAGLSLCGVGSTTAISNVQVTDCEKNAIELFGGTVNAKYLYSLKNKGIDFRIQLGYSGFMQFIFANKSQATSSSNIPMVEIQNDAFSSSNTPKTNPSIFNATLVGWNTSVNGSSGFLFKNNAEGAVFNSIMIGQNTGLLMEGDQVAASAGNNNLEVKGLVISSWKKDSIAVNFSSFNIKNWFYEYSYQNKTIKNLQDLGMENIYDNNNPLLTDTSMFKNNAVSNSTRFLSSFVEMVEYRGAFNNVDWRAGWTSDNPNDLEY